MHKIAIGLIILVIILCLTIFNIQHLDKKICLMQKEVEESYLIAARGNKEEAVAMLDAVFADWKSIDRYTRSVLHSDRVEAVYDAFYDFYAAMEEEESYYAKEQLIYHLNSILEQEKLSIDSVF